MSAITTDRARTYQHRSVEAQRRVRDARIEDLVFMAENGETVHGAARRLDISRSALDRFLLMNRRRDIWTRLTANDPLWGEHR
jgi:hypothetical protein